MSSVSGGSLAVLPSKKMHSERERIVCDLEEGVVQFGEHIVSLIELADPSKRSRGGAGSESQSRIVDKVFKRMLLALEGLHFLSLQQRGDFTHSEKTVVDPDLKYIQKAFYEREITFSSSDKASSEAMEFFHETVGDVSKEILSTFVDNLPHFISHANMQIATIERSLLESFADPDPSTQIINFKKTLASMLSSWKSIQEKIKEDEDFEESLAGQASVVILQIERLIMGADLYLELIAVSSKTNDVVTSLTSIKGDTDEDIAAFFDCYTEHKALLDDLELEEGFSDLVASLGDTPIHSLLQSLIERNKKIISETNKAFCATFRILLPSLSHKAGSLASLIHSRLAFVNPESALQMPNIDADSCAEIDLLARILSQAKDFIKELHLAEPKAILRKIKIAYSEKKELFDRLVKVQECLAGGKGLDNAEILLKLKKELLHFARNCSKLLEENTDPAFHEFIRPLLKKVTDCERYVKSLLLSLCFDSLSTYKRIYAEMISAEDKDSRWKDQVESAIAALQDFPDEDILSILDDDETRKLVLETHSVKWHFQFLLSQNQYAFLYPIEGDEECDLENPYVVASELNNHQEVLRDYTIEEELLLEPAHSALKALVQEHKTRVESLQEAYVEAVRQHIDENMIDLLEGNYVSSEAHGYAAWEAGFRAIKKLQNHFSAHADRVAYSPNKDKLIAELAHLMNAKNISELFLDSFALKIESEDFKDDFDFLYSRALEIKSELLDSTDSTYKAAVIAHLNKLQERLENLLCSYIKNTMELLEIPPSEMTENSVKALIEKTFAYFSRKIQEAGSIADAREQKATLKTLRDNILKFAEHISFPEEQYEDLFPENLQGIGISLKESLQAIALRDLESDFARFSSKIQEDLMLPTARSLGEAYFISLIEQFSKEHIEPFIFHPSDTPVQGAALSPMADDLIDAIKRAFLSSPAASPISEGEVSPADMPRAGTFGSLSTLTADNRTEDGTTPVLTSTPIGVFP